MKINLQIILIMALMMAMQSAYAQYTGGDGRGDVKDASNQTLLSGFDAMFFGGNGRGDFSLTATGLHIYTNITWTGEASTNWNAPGNWDLNVVPTAPDNITIPNVANKPIIGAASVVAEACNSLTIENGAILTIAAGKALTVSGILTNNTGNTGLLIKSDATGTGSLIHSTADIGATAQRYIAGWGVVANHGWHFLSSPVANQAISSTFVDVTLNPMSTNVDLYKWNETENLWINIKNSSNVYNQGTDVTNWSNDASPTFETGKGYMTAYNGDQTKTFTGILNVADVTLPGLTNTATKTNRGWHLVGNPFSSAIKWSQGSWVKTNIGSVPQIWNETNASYTVLSADGIIPAHNGFIVYVDEGMTGALTIPADARLHSNDAWYKNSAFENEIVLVARDPEGKTAQESIIGFNPNATEDFDMEHDSYFMAGFAPLFYSISQNQLFALNNLPELRSEMVVPMGFVKNQSSNFMIELEQNLPDQNLYLVDLKTNIEHKLSESPYIFTSETGDNANRFLLKFGSVGINNTPAAQSIIAWYYGNQLTVKTTEGITSLDVFNIQGQYLQHFQLQGSGLKNVSINLLPGVYFARIVNNGAMKTVKIIVQ